MLEFGYCIWLSPDSDCELYSICKDFNPHISLITQLEKNFGLEYISNIKKNNIHIKIIDIPVVTIESGFNALQFNVKIVNNVDFPLNPHEPHISFIYKYDTNISINEINEIKNKIDFNKIYTFNNYKLMCCNGHYNNWHKIIEYLV